MKLPTSIVFIAQRFLDYPNIIKCNFMENISYGFSPSLDFTIGSGSVVNTIISFKYKLLQIVATLQNTKTFPLPLKYTPGKSRVFRGTCIFL